MKGDYFRIMLHFVIGILTFLAKYIVTRGSVVMQGING